MKNTNNLDKDVLGHMLPQTLFACSCMHDGNNNYKVAFHVFISTIVIYMKVNSFQVGYA